MSSSGVFRKQIMVLCALALAMCMSARVAPAAQGPFDWPEASNESRPWTYWWWMGGAQDKENLTKVLELYRAAGMGGMHIVPIYGVKGYEDRFRDFLSPEWMELLAHTIAEGNRVGLGVDMSVGTGWPFGGPNVSAEDAAKKMEVQRIDAAESVRPELGASEGLIAVVARSHEGATENLTDDARDGSLEWTPAGGAWTVYVLRQAGTGQQVKRAAPGGAGNVLNPYDVGALERYLARFDAAFARTADLRPRAFYHDSFEYYNAQWSSDLLDTFRSRRGYDLIDVLPQWLAEPGDESAARITCDYRRTVAELHLDYIRHWVDWSHKMGVRTRNQAHGAPGNILDLYAASDIPETEIFGATGFPIPGLRLDPDFSGDRPHPLMIKFASSAAHMAGKRLVSAEACTWLAEHFKVSLAQAKPEIDQLFAGGINHIVYHGMAYSPLDDPWPGWLFYASTCFAPTGGLWRDLPALNAYIARCQAVLQSGEPANDLLLYFPVYDVWQSGATGAALRPLQVHNISDWLHCGGLAPVAEHLWANGYAFDYVSDELLMGARVEDGALRAGDAKYRALLLPPCEYMPLETLEHILSLAEGGATILAGALPEKEPGFANLEQRQREHDEHLAGLQFADTAGLNEARVGSGRILRGDDLTALLLAGDVPREAVAEKGVRFVRRTHESGYHYFYTNLGAEHVDDWFALGVTAQSAVLMDPRYEDRVGLAALRTTPQGGTECYLQLAPGESCILRTFTDRRVSGALWSYLQGDEDSAIDIAGPWNVTFIEGGPELPPPFETTQLESWTARGGAAETVAGTARYETAFEKPAGDTTDWVLDLGRVCESARVYVNGESVGTLFSLPFRVAIGAYLRDGSNTIAIEVTNLAANRIRDLDRRGVAWKKYYDANIVNIRYKPFDASGWDLMDSGLLGPVRLISADEVAHGAARRLEDIARVAPGWRGTILSEVDQSYVGWDVEIGDADNDGENEVLATGVGNREQAGVSHLVLVEKE